MSIEYFQKIRNAWRQARAGWGSSLDTQAGDWAENAPEDSKGAAMMRMIGPSPEMNMEMDPEDYTRDILKPDADSKTVPWLMNQIEEGKATIDRAYLFEAQVNGAGRMLKECRLPYKIKKVFGSSAFMREAKRSEEAIAKLREGHRSKHRPALREDFFSQDGYGPGGGPYDPNQYTEYAPLMGGYFFAQMYLTDMLKAMAYSFEAWNHNPLGHRIIDGLAQYTLGRRFDWHLNAKKNGKKLDVWEKFATDINLRQRLSKYWIREKLIFGELMLNKKNWTSIHPATVWEIVTEPTDISNVYYYYRSYPTQYQMFSGYNVPGAPGSKEVPAQRFIVEQIPYPQIIHLKGQCTSFEKRGRPKLFTVLGWMKRVKDLYNAQIVRAQMQSEYAWDVEINGNANDVSSFSNSNLYIPKGNGNTFVHNQAVKRMPMPVAPSGGRSGGDTTSDNVLAFIATAIGLPKDFFNVISTGGGNRATALVAAEPFTKVIEDEQADWEFLLHRMAEQVFTDAGLDYDEDDIEFTFPSVTKDTTTETIKNIMQGEFQGYISKETAAQLYYQEMGYTTGDYQDQQMQIKTEASRGDLSGGPATPEGRLGQTPTPGGIVDSAAPPDPLDPTPDEDNPSPIHGQGKVDLAHQLNRL